MYETDINDKEAVDKATVKLLKIYKEVHYMTRSRGTDQIWPVNYYHFKVTEYGRKEEERLTSREKST